MRTKNYQPTAAEKRWHDEVAGLGCLVCHVREVELHHVAGASAKHCKVHVGQQWILPLCHRHHDMVTRSRDELCEAMYGFVMVGAWDCQKMLMCEVVGKLGLPPGGSEVMGAILDYRR